MIIDPRKHLCHIIDAVDICKNIVVKHVQEGSNKFYLCTVRHSYTIDRLTKVNIDLQFVEKDVENKYLYKEVLIYDCTCALHSNTLCTLCADTDSRTGLSYGREKLVLSTSQSEFEAKYRFLSTPNSF